MLTNPNTLGLFETHIARDRRDRARRGGLVYYDGANLNALLGHRAARGHGLRRRALQPAQDVLHAARRRRAGRGPGRRRRRARAVPPVPASRGRCKTRVGTYDLDHDRRSRSGRCAPSTATSACRARLRLHPAHWAPTGLRRVSENAVLNANYVLQAAPRLIRPAVRRRCMHEFVARRRSTQKEHGVQSARRRQAAARPRRPPADDLLPADRPRRR